VTSLDRALIRRKLATISRNIGELEPVAKLELDEYRRDRFRLKGSERMLQEIVEAAVDANNHLLRSSGAELPSDYHESFVAMGRAGILPTTLALALATAAGLRNRLVHEYDAIDDSIVLRAIGTARRQFAEFVAAVEQYISEH
jgi:uncharacterized protein YutE (UPF0331/DUF86 family)